MDENYISTDYWDKRYSSSTTPYEWCVFSNRYDDIGL